MRSFEIELDKLLKEYLGEEGFKKFSFNVDKSKVAADGISGKINDFYRDQLQINVSSYTERVKIDRTITFSEKKLSPEIFSKFLIDLGKICLNGGKHDLAAEIYKKAKLCSTNNIDKAESLLGMANIYSRRANWLRSLEIISEARELFKTINEKTGLCKCENILGSIYGEMGDVESAKKCFKRGLSLINFEKDTELAANLEANLGIIDNIQGSPEEALVHLNNAVKIYGKNGNNKAVAEIHLNIGMVYFEKDEYELAVAAFDEGIEIAKHSRFLSVLCLLYHGKSRVLIAMNAIYYAAEFADKALEISHSVDDKLTLADIYKVKGIIERHLRNYKEAENYLLSSLRINTALKNEMNIAETSLELGLLYQELKIMKSKNLYLKNSLSYFNKINAIVKVRKIENMLGIESV